MKPASKLVLGTANFGTSVNAEDALEIVAYALDNGITAIDTADSYGSAEEIVGKALKGKRDNVFLATKVGNPSPHGSGLSAKHIEESIVHSLKRLQTDRVDLYFAHNWDKQTSLSETLTAFDDVVRKGYTEALGCSNFTRDHIAESLVLAKELGVTPFSVVQPPYNLIERVTESEILPFALEKHIKVWAYSPLAGGILTGKYAQGIPAGSRAEDYPGANPREAAFIPKITPENRAVGTKVAEVAKKYGITASQLAVAWVLSQKAVTSVVVGVRNKEQLRELLDSAVPEEALALL